MTQGFKADLPTIDDAYARERERRMEAREYVDRIVASPEPDRLAAEVIAGLLKHFEGDVRAIEVERNHRSVHTDYSIMLASYLVLVLTPGANLASYKQLIDGWERSAPPPGDPAIRSQMP